MRKINIKDLSIKINLLNMLNAISQKRKIEIDIDGEIFLDSNNNLAKAIVFKLENSEQYSNILEKEELLNNIFKNYKFTLENGYLLLNPLKAWQEIIFLNQSRRLYFDHQTDGVELFEDKALEDIGWYAVACDISYREISDFIESNCEGILVYYDNQVQFNGFVIVKDLENTKFLVKDFIIKTIKNKIKKELIDIKEDDVIEALEFFELKV